MCFMLSDRELYAVQHSVFSFFISWYIFVLSRSLKWSVKFTERSIFDTLCFFRLIGVTQAVPEICEVNGEEVMPRKTDQNRFKRFKYGNFELADMHRTGRTVQFNKDRLNELIHVVPAKRRGNWQG